MQTYIMLSRLSPGSVKNPQEVKNLASEVSSKIKSECPGVQWRDSFATLGRFDVVDVVEANEPEEIEKVAMILRSYGREATETLLATPWKRFLGSL